MNAAYFVPMILASNKRVEEERAEREAARIKTGSTPVRDSEPKREGKTDRHG